VVGVKVIRDKYKALSPVLDERARRMWAAAEARAMGWGAVTIVATATGLARNTIYAGLKELSAPTSPSRAGAPRAKRTRRPGGGRKALVDTDPELLDALEALVEPTTRGDPESPLRWTCKSTPELARTLTRQGHPVSARTVAQLLHRLEYSLQGNAKTEEGTSHPDRDGQFKYISRQTRLFQARHQPVISVDTKKKELVGLFGSPGREWQPKGQPVRVNVHDFKDDQLGKAIPYGVYDLSANAGWVSVGIDHDTPAFAVQSIRMWWGQMGRRAYPDATELLITADSGGSNGYRARAWKMALHAFAAEARMRISVCHFPPGTSKWNKIEHRMFCHITQNWRGQPLVSLDVIVNLIGHTRTEAGLRVRAKLDRRRYALGERISRADLARLRLKPANFHGEWNYAILPS
jgi:hypothetical protein